MTRRGYKIPPPQPDLLVLAFLGGAALWIGWHTAEFTVSAIWSAGSFIVAGLIEAIEAFGGFWG